MVRKSKYKLVTISEDVPMWGMGSNNSLGVYLYSIKGYEGRYVLVKMIDKHYVMRKIDNKRKKEIEKHWRNH